MYAEQTFQDFITLSPTTHNGGQILRRVKENLFTTPKGVTGIKTTKIVEVLGDEHNYSLFQNFLFVEGGIHLNKVNLKATVDNPHHFPTTVARPELAKAP